MVALKIIITATNFMKLKYILDQYGNFALFSKVNTHSDTAKGFYSKPVSAGFCNLVRGSNGGKTQGHIIFVDCYGESVSLKLASRKEDSEIITNKINNPYE